MAIRVTVVIPAYNATKTIHDGLDSFARQSFPADEVELIIVDDESTDGTPEYIEHYVKDWGARTRGCAYFAKLIGGRRRPGTSVQKRLKESFSCSLTPTVCRTLTGLRKWWRRFSHLE